MKRFVLIMLSIFTCAIATAATETINWYVGDTTYATTTCQTGGDITLPQTPTKYGYTFNGWIGYTPIEYLKSTGTQYIDTGYIPNQDTGVKIKLEANNVANDGFVLFGSGKSYNERVFESYIWDGYLQFSYGYTYTNAPRKPVIGDIVIVNWDKNVVNHSVNGVEQNEIVFPYRNFTSPYQMRIFTITRPTSVTNASAAGKEKIYYCQIYDNNTLVRDMIPVLDENGTPCMFDKVEHKFYYNAGTGQFIAGPQI